MKARVLRRYQIIVGSAYLLCLLVAAALLYVQYLAALERHRVERESGVSRSAESVDLLLAKSVAHVRFLRQLAEDTLAKSEPEPRLDPYRLVDREDGAAFRAILPEGVEPAPGAVGLSGEGSSLRRSADFRWEVAMALELASGFHAVRKNLPEVAWVYYTSRQGFLSLYPAKPGNDWIYSPAMLQQAFFLGGEPDRNPSRASFWTPEYEDLAGLGPMVTCAAPVDFRGQFRGTVALDLTLKSIAAYLHQIGEPGGLTFLVQDSDGKRLTEPKPDAESGFDASALAAFSLPQAISGKYQEFDTKQAHIDMLPLKSAPWHLVHIEPQTTLLSPEVRRPILIFLVLAVTISALLALAHRAAQREFVRPAVGLVDYLQACSQGRIERFSAPSAWRPWFSLVADTFREKQRLLLELKEHNEHLDELVKRRTEEVENANRELKLLLEHLNRARLEMLRSQQELKLKNQQLEELASHDGLTGIANRSSFDQALEAEWQRMTRIRAPLSMIMVDIDAFKAYNDNLGHQAGDRALVAVARALDECFRRAGEIVARYGGEEFAVLLPGVALPEALRLAEAARARIQALGLMHPASPAGSVLTASFGVSTFKPARELKPEALVANADAALYQAKSAGRNRVYPPA